MSNICTNTNISSRLFLKLNFYLTNGFKIKYNIVSYNFNGGETYGSSNLSSVRDWWILWRNWLWSLISNKKVLFDFDNFKIYKLNNSTSKEVFELFKGTRSLKELQDNQLSNFFKEKNHFNKKEAVNIKCLKINVNNICNLKCKYCYAEEGTYGQEKEFMLTSFDIDNFLNTFKSIHTISFFGGEPLLSIDIIEEICKKISSKNRKIIFLAQTNGTIFSSKIKEVIEKYNIQLTVSIDGPKSVNDINRIFKNNSGTYDMIEATIFKLRDYVISIQATYSPNKHYSKDDIYNYLYEKFKIQNIKIFDVILDGENKGVTFRSFQEEIKDILLNKFTLPNQARNIFQLFFANQNLTFKCQAGSELITINADGKIYPCHMFHTFYKDLSLLGNIKDFNLDSFNKKRKNIMEKTSKKMCQNCIAKFHCNTCFVLDKDNKFDCQARIDRTVESFEYLAEVVKEGKLLEFSKRFPKLNKVF